MIRARIYKSAKKYFVCQIEESKVSITATSRGNLLKQGESLVVGDYVNLVKSETEDEYIIDSREERANEIFRIIVREQKKKVTAANCDLLVILSSSSKPLYKRGIIDRFLVRAAQWGIRPIVIFNKMDEYTGDDFDILFERDRLKELGVEYFEISAKFQDYEKKYLKNGLLELKNILKGTTSIFVGQSGVGKSKAIALLSEGKVELRIQSIGKGGKGAHTTTWSEIIDCHDFYLIDSPGIRSFSLDDIDPEELISYFPDVADRAHKCKFRNCKHEEKSKDCAFYQLDSEDRETKLLFSRLESYTRIRDEISQIPFWKKKV